jgi:tRNA(adenine34) deaminase
MSHDISPDDDRVHGLRWHKRAAAEAGKPVGAGAGRQVLASGHNAIEPTDPTAHAEVNARAAARAGNYCLDDCTLYVTLEPCAMCSGGFACPLQARGVWRLEPKTGAAGSVLNVFGYPQLNHHTEVTGGVLASECAHTLQRFFEDRRAQQQHAKTPLREDALRTLDSTWQGLGLPTDLSCFTTDLPALNGLRLHWFDNRKAPTTSQAVPDIYLHGLDDWSAVYSQELGGSRPVIAVDLPGFGMSDKPKKEKAHNLSWHAQVLFEFLAQVQPAPVALHAPPSMAPLVHAVQALWSTHQGEPLRVQWHSTSGALTPALRDAPYPDTGHRAGPRALRAFSALLATPPPVKQPPTPQS